jgi:hypothetical protein
MAAVLAGSTIRLLATNIHVYQLKRFIRLPIRENLIYSREFRNVSLVKEIVGLNAILKSFQIETFPIIRFVKCVFLYLQSSSN